MPFEFKLPDIGEGVVEGEIVTWRVKEGDLVQEDQPLVEVMTDKATVEIHSPYTGVITRRVGKEGDTVAVGSTLVVIEEMGEAAEVQRKEGGRREPLESTAEPPRGPDLISPGSGIAATPGEGATLPARKLATPATRRLAREMGIDLTAVTGTGTEGRITKEDLQVAAATKGVAPSGTEERIPLIGLRKRIAEKMVRSRRSAAHYGYVEEVDVTALVQLHKEAEPLGESKHVKLTYLAFIVKASLAGLKKYPFMNATLDEEKQEIVLKNYHHIGIAVATDRGLIVPVVKDADRKSIWEIAADIQRLAEDARHGRSKLEDLQGSTFTITSLGPLGGILAMPIINYPEVAILGVHKIRVRPEYVGDVLEPRHMMNISLSIDHRVVDGMVGAQFAAEVKRLLESPALLFL
ncbi:MAG: 2-oxo acid dehydrogenase subunit E2 [Acidobacteria bacterium]|nr:2-oxo acid dehydrogenase subunit E2 [Acidobacteriota bacterium]